MSIQLLCPVFTSVFLVIGVLYIFGILTHQAYDLQLFSSILQAPFHSVGAEVFNFDAGQFIYFYLCCLLFWHLIQEIIAKITIRKPFF
jgi:hypothetical protein